jgi:TolA-binding protein
MIRRLRLPSLFVPLCAGWILLVSTSGGAEREAVEPAVESTSVAEPEVQATQPPEPAEAKAAVVTAVSPEVEKPRLRDGEEIQSMLTLGSRLTERSDYEAADIAFRQVLNARGASDADLKTALLGLAYMHRKQGMLTKAAAIYERYLKDYPDDERIPDALLDLGRTLRALGAHKAAISKFYNVISSTLKLPGEGFDRYQLLAKTAQFEIAETHFLAGDYIEANKFFTRLRLLDLAPADRARAHFKAGFALRLQGELDKAVNTLRTFVEQWPDDENVPEARYLLAISLRELKRPQEAFASTLELLRTEKSRIAVDPKRWAYWQRRTGNHLANDFFESGDTLNARAIYAGLLELSPEPTWRLPITYQLALCYERLGMNDRAKSSYQAIVDAGGATPSPDFAELITMSKWRIEHLDWRERLGNQVTSFFDSASSKNVGASPSTKPVPAAATP